MRRAARGVSFLDALMHSPHSDSTPACPEECGLFDRGYEFLSKGDLRKVDDLELTPRQSVAANPSAPAAVAGVATSGSTDYSAADNRYLITSYEELGRSFRERQVLLALMQGQCKRDKSVHQDFSDKINVTS
ncbi:hypothetical protein L7F22_054583 [Adiantum nelumboides]|nr:hypothetical protein [Adiantum nelumboides]